MPCRLSPTFEKLDRTDQVLLLLSTNEAMNGFFKTRDSRLNLSNGSTPKPIILFHMSYHMAILITMPSFLKIFMSLLAKEQGSVIPTPTVQLILRSLYYAASSMTRLAQIYYDSHTFQYANPVIIHHILSASIVHLMNSTATNVALKRRSTRLLRQSVALLSQLAHKWPVRSYKSIGVIEVLAHRWGSSASLPSRQSSTSTHDGRATDPLESTIYDPSEGFSQAGSKEDADDQFHHLDSDGNTDYMRQYTAPDFNFFDLFERGAPSYDLESFDLFKVFEEFE